MPGKHANLITGHLNADENAIIDLALSKEFDINNGGSTINVGIGSPYRYIVIKPPDDYEHMFNLTNEMIVLFNSYQEFDSRDLTAIEKAERRLKPRPLEKICSIVIAKDRKVELHALEARNKDEDMRVIIPFTFDELLKPVGDVRVLIRNRFRKYFHSQDLFGISSALKKDTYFFGRQRLINSIALRHKSHENSALFGLRRTGKTSVIYGITRALERDSARYVIIDWQDPSLRIRRWNESLHSIVTKAREEISKQIKQQIDTVTDIENDPESERLRKQHKQLQNIKIDSEDRYNEKDAARHFRADLSKIWKAIGKTSILIIMDEIENITFNVSPSVHWKSGTDFVNFWQALRTAQQQDKGMFSCLIVGTNPTCVEQASIQGVPNPIFSQYPHSYIEPFDIPQTKDMISTLGRMMGLQFEEGLFTLINRDFGGHPFLMRKVCSIIHERAPRQRPVDIDEGVYQEAKIEMIEKHENYFGLVMNVLKEHYQDEYEMLEYLALGRKKDFADLASVSNQYTQHLLGYGIVKKGVQDGDYNFRIKTIEKYIADKKKYQRLLQSNEDRLAEVSERRNALEIGLRKLIRRELEIHLGMAKATEAVLAILGKKDELQGLSYDQLFEARISRIYFEDLRKIIVKHWERFKNIFGGDQSKFERAIEALPAFEMMMKALNDRPDAHAKEVIDTQFALVRACFDMLENSVKRFG